MKSQVCASHYAELGYDTKKRFCSYWHQIYELASLKPSSILEIGVGNGFVSGYLSDRGFKVTTLDTDIGLCPDGVGSVLAIPFAEYAFDVVACYEVLEHIPFENFARVLCEIYRVTSLHAVLSLPDNDIAYRIYVQIPKIGVIRKLMSWSRPWSRVHHFDGQHYWEIGKAGYRLKRIVSQIEDAGFKIVKTYRVFEYPRHRFFVLHKGEAHA